MGRRCKMRCGQSRWGRDYGGRLSRTTGAHKDVVSVVCARMLCRRRDMAVRGRPLSRRCDCGERRFSDEARAHVVTDGMG